MNIAGAAGIHAPPLLCDVVARGHSSAANPIEQLAMSINYFTAYGAPMKRPLAFAIAAVLLVGSGSALAFPQDDHGHGNDKHGDDHGHNPKDDGRHDNGKHKGWYKKGDRLPANYYSHDYYVTDYQRYHLRRPDPGYRWVRADGGQFYLTLISSGVIIDVSGGL